MGDKFVDTLCSKGVTLENKTIHTRPLHSKLRSLQLFPTGRVAQNNSSIPLNGWGGGGAGNPSVRPFSIPANFFWDVSVRFLSWECWDFLRRHDHFRTFPKKSEVFRRHPNSSEDVRSLPKVSLLPVLFTIARKVLSFIHFTHGFRSLHGSELT